MKSWNLETWNLKIYWNLKGIPRFKYIVRKSWNIEIFKSWNLENSKILKSWNLEILQSWILKIMQPWHLEYWGGNRHLEILKSCILKGGEKKDHENAPSFFKVSRFQDFKIQDFKISRFQDSRCQDFQVSRFQDFKISRFPLHMFVA